MLSDGIQIKLHPVYDDSLSSPLAPVRLDSGPGQERILHVRALVVDCDDKNGTGVHLFWLQSKPSRIFHAMIDLEKKRLEHTQLILPCSSTNGTKLPFESNVSYFDVLSNCGRCDHGVTFDLTIVNEITGVITVVALDFEFNVKGIKVDINGTTNPGQVLISTSALFWLEDSSCLKVVSLGHKVNTTSGSSILPWFISSLPSPSKLLCINQYSSNAAATAFHISRENVNYIYLVTSTGDVVRLLPSPVNDSPYQLLFSSAMYAEKDVLKQYATTFNAIQVIEEQTLVRVFLSIKSQGFLIELTFKCTPNSSKPCQFIKHNNILAERHLLDFSMIDLNNKKSFISAEGHTADLAINDLNEGSSSLCGDLVNSGDDDNDDDDDSAVGTDAQLRKSVGHLMLLLCLLVFIVVIALGSSIIIGMKKLCVNTYRMLN